MGTTIKLCRTCGEGKPLSDFYKHPSNSDGVQTECKVCFKARAKRNREARIDEVREYDRKRGRTPERKALVTARRPKYREKHTEYNREWRQKNPEKYAAHIVVNNAVRDGKLTKGKCEVCRSPDVEAHHDDYTKPLNVRWLCKEHHGATRRIDPAEAAE